jgi:hypothetical protein
MELLHRRCCGLDVHKETVVACLRLVSDGKVTTEVRTFQTTTAELLRLSEWLAVNRCTPVAMEATCCAFISIRSTLLQPPWLRSMRKWRPTLSPFAPLSSDHVDSRHQEPQRARHRLGDRHRHEPVPFGRTSHLLGLHMSTQRREHLQTSIQSSA